MSKLWTILSVLGVANFLAVCGLIAWLGMSQRLSLDRVRAVKTALVETIPAEADRLAEEEKKKAEEAKAVEAKAKEQKPTMTAQEKLAVRLEATELDMQRFKKLQSDIEAMQTNLRAQADLLVTERAKFEKEKAAFDSLRKQVEAKTGDEQFQKTLAVLEGMDTKNAVATVKEILSGIDPGTAAGLPTTGEASKESAGTTGEDRALRYLNAMSPAKRTEILNLMAKGEPALAAKLLERLRTFGILPASGNKVP
jgi:hypothetical protein